MSARHWYRPAREVLHADAVRHAFQWVRVWLDTIDLTEMRELVVDAWRMVVPKRVAAEYLDAHP